MMYLGKDAVGIATRRSANGIFVSTVIPEQESKSITFPVVGKPYGVMIMTNNRNKPNNGYTIICMYTAWTEYQGGMYATARVLCIASNGTEDHWQISGSNTYFVYNSTNNTFYAEVPSTIPGLFRTDREYNLYYFTYPQDNVVTEVTSNA